MGAHIVLKEYIGVYIEADTTIVKVTDDPVVAERHNLLTSGTLYYSTHPAEKYGLIRVRTSRRKNAELAIVNPRLSDGFGVYLQEFFYGMSGKAEVVIYLQSALSQSIDNVG